MKCITREHVDRVACPWLIKKFIDPNAEFHVVPADCLRRFVRVLPGDGGAWKGMRSFPGCALN